MNTGQFNVCGLPEELEVSPVEIRCTVCGATEKFGGDGYCAGLDELVNWQAGHRCVGILTVN